MDDVLTANQELGRPGGGAGWLTVERIEYISHYTRPSWARVGRTQQDPRAGSSCRPTAALTGALPQLPPWTLTTPLGGCSPLLKAVLGLKIN